MLDTIPVWFWFAVGALFGTLVPLVLAAPTAALGAGVVGMVLLVRGATRTHRRHVAGRDDELLATRRLLGGGRRVIPSDPIERVRVLPARQATAA